MGQVVGLEFGRGVCLAVFTDQVVLDLAVRVAVAGRQLDKLNGRVHGISRHRILRAPVDGLRNHIWIDGPAGIDGVAVAQTDRAQNRIAAVGRKALAVAHGDKGHERRVGVAVHSGRENYIRKDIF